jgi:hypothetical protein
MISWAWRWIWGLCSHEFEIIETVAMIDHETGIPYGTKYVQRCEKCGKLIAETV